MLNLAYWCQTQGLNTTLRKILDLQTTSLGKLGKYRQPDTVKAIIDLVKLSDEVANVALINGKCLHINIIIATKYNAIYRIFTARPTCADHKNLNDWLNCFCDTPCFISQIDNRIIWI
jgi:hypothetical protein